jgi:hypothetical protein
MFPIKRISEKALTSYLECPMRSAASIVMPESPVLACSEETARWLITEVSAGRTPSARETREFFDTQWQQTAYFRLQDGFTPKELGDYQRHVVQGVRACRRLRDVIWRCGIIQPVSPYELPVGEIVITGEYAVLCSSRSKTHAFALYLRDQGVRIKPLVPDIVSFARQLDLRNRWIDPANLHWRIQKISVMNYWVTRDLSAEHWLASSLASDMLLGAAGVVAGHAFPVPGDYCKSCPTRACQL